MIKTIKNIIAENEAAIAEKRSLVANCTDASELSILKGEIRSLENENKKYNAEVMNMVEQANTRSSAMFGISDSDKPGYEVRSAFKKDLQDIAKRSVTTVSDIALAIPEVYDEDLVVYLKDNCELLNEVNLTVQAGDVVINRSSSVVTAEWIAAGNEANKVEAQKFAVDEKVILKANGLVAAIEISELATIQSQYAFDTTFVAMLGNAMIEKLVPAIIAGTGEGMPLGVINDEAVTTVVEVAEADFTNPDFWIDFEDVINDRYKANTKIVMNGASFSALKKLKDGTGAYLGDFSVNHDGNKNYLLDKPVIKVDSTALKSFAAAGDGEVFAVSGNWKHYRLNDASNKPTIRKYQDPATLTEVTKAVKYVGGRVTVPYSFIIFKKKG